jgi:hypothetical protein
LLFSIIVVLVTLHLFAVSVASLGPLFCIWLRRRAQAGDALAAALGRLLALRSLQLLLIGAVLGLIQLGAAEAGADEPYFRALATIRPGRWWFAGIEFFFSLACMLLYHVLWDRRLPRLVHPAIALVAATNLLYHLPPLFVVAGVVSERPEPSTFQVELPGMLGDADVLARLFHFYLAAVVIAGSYVSYLAARSEPVNDGGRECLVRGGRVALAAAVLQLPLGVVVLIQMTDRPRQVLLGGDLLATVCLALGVTATLVLLQHLAAVALGDTERQAALRAGALVLAVMLLMVAARCRVRQVIARTARPQPAAATDDDGHNGSTSQNAPGVP